MSIGWSEWFDLACPLWMFLRRNRKHMSQNRGKWQEMDIALSELKRAEARVNELRQLWAGSAAPNVGKR